MDARHFDGLARSLHNRRSTVGFVGVWLVGSASAPALIEARKRKKKPCPPCRTRKKGKCKGTQADGAACSGGACRDGVCAPLACGSGGPCTVFVTSTKVSGNLGGVTGADATCQAAAVSAGLSGTYRAWLSDPVNSPTTRFIRSTGPYRLVNGTVIADSWSDLTDGTPLRAAINVTETGGAHSGDNAGWSNTGADGNPLPPGATGEGNCVNWTSASNAIQGGMGSTSIPALWPNLGVTFACVNLLSLFCFQQS